MRPSKWPDSIRIPELGVRASKAAKNLARSTKRLLGPLLPERRRVRPWYQARGNETRRLDYDLDESSLVFDLGGYRGDWAADIFTRYCCTLHVFEPVPEYVERIRSRFSRNPKVTVHPFGLASADATVALAVDESSSSLFKSGAATCEARLVKASDFLAANRIESIDLMKINIEGGEYDLLDHLIGSELIGNIGNVQIQFHDFVPNARKRMERIQRELSATHHLTYQYVFVWENWERT
jgi:FkbM family methyltransferase